MKIDKKDIARHLWQQQTPAEKKLWNILRNRQFENLKFLKHHTLKQHIVDFYCHELKLVIELDGAFHNKKGEKYNDEQRDFHLSFLGYRILMYNNEVVFNNLQHILEEIKNIKNKLPFQQEKARVSRQSILSTKKLTATQKKMFQDANISVTDYDAIEINFIDFEAPKKISFGIFTSQNAVKAFFSHHNCNSSEIEKAFCVGEKTKSLLEENGQKVTNMMNNAQELADFIKINYQHDTFHFFCGSLRRDEIPSTLKKENITLFEVKTYETALKTSKIERKVDGILFFSPTGVRGFCIENEIEASAAFCIGKTTSSEVKKHTTNIFEASTTTVESVIEKAIKILGET
ncbi:MAG: uroporphyrinogen-III synthase [Sediminicola sp.]|jgi:uroporphyrinogen-III synthase|tara:strand:- start:5721 stop:6758 length:1038 start_codon:yes stop_codon:yes gene_type:complete